MAQRQLLQDLMDSCEKRGAAREREKLLKGIYRHLDAATKGIQAIHDYLAVFDGREIESEPKPQPKKRKSVEASARTIEDVRSCYFGAAGKVLTVKNIRQLIPTLGPKYIASACRSLVESHVLEKVGAKGYRLAQRKENGLDETVSAESSAR